MKSHLKVSQVRSTANRDSRQELVIKGLGLRGVGSEVIVANTPSFRGMVKKVIHLLKVEELDQPKS